MWDAPKSSYFGNLNDLPDIIEGVRVLKGVEANIMDFDGHLDMNDDILGRLELVVASMHGGIMPTGTVDECTAAWLAVAENPNVDIPDHRNMHMTMKR
jgi:putative hydrolase